MLPERLNKIFAKRGGDLFILVFSLLLAFFMWGMHRFSQTYSTFFDYKVDIESNIAGREKYSTSYNSLVLRGKATGFYIMKQRLSEKANLERLALQVDSKQLKTVKERPDFFYLKSEDVKEKIQQTLGNDFQLESITTDTLYFQFARQANRKVPVAVDQDITFAPQYTALGRVQLRPDSVVVYGNESVVKGIDSVYTQLIVERDADAPVQGVIGIKPIRGVRFSEEQVYYSLPVGRYFENRVTVKVNVVNSPSSVNVIMFPQEVTVRYKMLFDNKKELDATDFQVVIDYNKIGPTNVARPYLLKSPSNIFSVSIEPVFIECIVN